MSPVHSPPARTTGRCGAGSAAGPVVHTAPAPDWWHPHRRRPSRRLPGDARGSPALPCRRADPAAPASAARCAGRAGPAATAAATAGPGVPGVPSQTWACQFMVLPRLRVLEVHLAGRLHRVLDREWQCAPGAVGAPEHTARQVAPRRQATVPVNERTATRAIGHRQCRLALDLARCGDQPSSLPMGWLKMDLGKVWRPSGMGRTTSNPADVRAGPWHHGRAAPFVARIARA